MYARSGSCTVDPGVYVPCVESVCTHVRFRLQEFGVTKEALRRYDVSRRPRWRHVMQLTAAQGASTTTGIALTQGFINYTQVLHPHKLLHSHLHEVLHSCSHKTPSTIRTGALMSACMPQHHFHMPVIFFCRLFMKHSTLIEIWLAAHARLHTGLRHIDKLSRLYHHSFYVFLDVTPSHAGPVPT